MMPRRGIALAALPEPRRSKHELTGADIENELIEAVLAWNARRLVVNELRAERAALRCDATGAKLVNSRRGEDDDVAPCYECVSCYRRKDLNQQIYLGKKTLSRLRQEFQAYANRLTPPRVLVSYDA